MSVPPGVRLGPYEVLGLIGAGGMGEVYKARDIRLDRTVALKILPPELAVHPERQQRFEREAKTVSQLSHPHICALYDVGEAELPSPEPRVPFDSAQGRPSTVSVSFLVMEHLEGETLAARLERGALPLDQALRMGADIADALAYAHRHGIVHRDLKPANVMLTASGVKLLDFGLAKLRSGFGPPASGFRATTTDDLTTEGKVLGTVPYMAPEQIEGRETDARTDIFALGCLLYEMVTGGRAFEGDTSAALMSAILRDDPPPLTERQPLAPPALDRVVRTCLAKDPEERWHSAADVARELTWMADERRLARMTSVPEEGRRPTARARARRWMLSRAVLVTGLLAVLLLGVAGSAWVQQSRVRWARTVALPEAARLLGQRRNLPALRLLRQAERVVPEDPLLLQLLRESTCRVNVVTVPAGADVSVRDFFDASDEWEPLGRAPIKNVRLPVWLLVWRITAQGFQAKEVLARTDVGESVRFSLRPAASVPPGMVDVAGAMPGSALETELREFWIDEYEVTNRQFKDFMERGGYERRDYWAEPIVRDGVPVPDARREFRDRTGRPGPAAWELGTYPAGEADYPVGGVSWYEAAAYCRSVGKDLPSVHHWEAAAFFPAMTEFAPYSRFGASSPAPVGASRALGFFGTYDMAGNVKEWVWNRTEQDERRYVLGGSWNEPSYMFGSHDAQLPLERQPTYGFRCAKYGAPLAQSLRPVEALVRDYRRERPVDDTTYAVFESLYRYDPLPLDARVESTVDRYDYARIEQVSVAAAYGSDRVPILLFLPRTRAVPYQAVIWFPAENVLSEPGPFGLVEREQPWFLFLVRSGRAVVVPIYQGSFERKIRGVHSPHGWRDFLIQASKDLGRAVDYVETRRDLDATKLAYYGISSGAAAGPVMTAIEPRFRASILLGGGLSSLPRWSEAEVFSFVPRVRVPTLMINGRHDFFFPLETSQVPMFEWLGTQDKKHRVFESGHLPSEWQEVMKEILDWLDQHLGEVTVLHGE